MPRYTIEFKDWDEGTDYVWEDSVPLLRPKRGKVRKFASKLKSNQLILPGFETQLPDQRSYFDELATRVYETFVGWDDQADCEIHQVRVDSKRISPDSILVKDIQDRIHRYLTNEPYIGLSGREVCPYCNSMLKSTIYEDHTEKEFGFLLEACTYCNFWTWHYFVYAYISRDYSTAYGYTTFLGKLREFDTKLPEGCLEEIGSWIRRNPSVWHSIHPTRFEKLVTDIFRANYQHADVTHVGRPDDGGIDVIYVDTDQKQWLIQVKRRENPSTTESVSTIRNLLGAMLLQDGKNGIVVSTADHFSYQAYAAVNRAHEQGMTLKLIDRYALDHMLEGVLLINPWKQPLKQTFPEFIPYLEATLLDSNTDSYDASKLIASYDPRPTKDEIEAYQSSLLIQHRLNQIIHKTRIKRESLSIRYMIEIDIDKVKEIADANRDSLSFVTRGKFVEAIEQERGLVILEMNQVVGFVLFRHRRIDKQTTISDICVDQKYRSQDMGWMLVQALVDDCQKKSREFIQLKCPVDLDANGFYERLGFRLHMIEEGKKRQLKVWRLAISPCQAE